MWNGINGALDPGGFRGGSSPQPNARVLIIRWRTFNSGTRIWIAKMDPARKRTFFSPKISLRGAFTSNREKTHRSAISRHIAVWPPTPNHQITIGPSGHCVPTIPRRKNLPRQAFLAPDTSEESGEAVPPLDKLSWGYMWCKYASICPVTT